MRRQPNIFKWAKYLRHFAKEDTGMVTEHT